jgi:ethanolamine ammonia-lyase small subunit
MAFRPDQSQTDAHRNLISNIHARGLTAPAAAERILNLATRMMAQQSSGFGVREELPEASGGARLQE